MCIKGLLHPFPNLIQMFDDFADGHHVTEIDIYIYIYIYIPLKLRNTLSAIIFVLLYIEIGFSFKSSVIFFSFFTP